MPHICVSDGASIGSDNGLVPNRHQAFTQTNAGLLSSGLWGTNISETRMGILSDSIKEIYLKFLSAEMMPFCPGGDELTVSSYATCAWGQGLLGCTHINGQAGSVCLQGTTLSKALFMSTNMWRALGIESLAYVQRRFNCRKRTMISNSSPRLKKCRKYMLLFF